MNRKTRVMALILVIVMILALLASVVLPYLYMISSVGFGREKEDCLKDKRAAPTGAALLQAIAS